MRDFQEVRTIVGELCKGLSALFPHEQMETILYGSYARGDADSGSDIDVLILVDASRQVIMDKSWQIGDLAAELLLHYGIVVSPIVENRDFFQSNTEILPFFRNINQEGVRLSA